MLALLEVDAERDLVVRLRRARGRSTTACVRVRDIVEKPQPEDAPSNLAVIGRYVFTPEIFDALDRIDARRRRRDPAHRRDRAAARDRSRCTAACSPTAATTSARSSTSCGPTSSSRSTATDLGPELADFLRALRARPAVVIAARRDPARRRPGRASSARSPRLEPVEVDRARRARPRARGRRRRRRSRCRRSPTPRWTATRCAPPTPTGAAEGAPVRLRVVGELAGRSRAHGRRSVPARRSAS